MARSRPLHPSIHLHPNSSTLIHPHPPPSTPVTTQRYLPALRLWVCDMDPEMMEVARCHFAYRSNARTHTVAAEGMALIEALGAAATDTNPPSTAPTPPSPHPLPPSLPLQPPPAAALSATPSISPAPPPSVLSPLLSDVLLSPILLDLPLDLLCIDADSKDPSLGLSAPPQVHPDSDPHFLYCGAPLSDCMTTT